MTAKVYDEVFRVSCQARRLVVGALFCIVAVGCTGPQVERQELTGMYSIQYPYGVEELLVQGDGTYRQSFADDGKSFAPLNQGKWELKQGDFWDGQLLVLHDPVIVDDGFGRRANKKASDALWQIRIRKRWSGGIKLLVNEDLGYEFVKE